MSRYTISTHLVRRPAMSHFKAHSWQVPLSTLAIWRCISIMSLECKPEQMIPFSPAAYCFDPVLILSIRHLGSRKYTAAQGPSQNISHPKSTICVLAFTFQNINTVYVYIVVVLVYWVKHQCSPWSPCNLCLGQHKWHIWIHKQPNSIPYQSSNLS